jgi:tetratricopeptide (TPR) repeat protein
MISDFRQLLRPGIKLLAMVALVSSWLVPAQDQSTGGLHGKICDGSGKPVASIQVVLQREGEPTTFDAQTDSEGNYGFAPLKPGVYRLGTSGSRLFRDASVPSVSIAAGQSKTLDVTLEVRSQAEPGDTSTGSPSFFDPPQFTVSGVTDTTNLGGHGSEPVMRNREAVEKDVISLGAGSPARASVPGSNGYDLALKYANAGDYARARHQLESVLAHRPTAEAHHLLASVDEKLGNSLDAVREYERAADLDPSESNLFDWASELLLHHAPEPAIEVFTKGNRRFPASTRMLIGLAAAEFAAGSYEKAAERLCQASDLHPDDPLPYLFLGKIQRSENTISAEVVGHLHRFAKLRPDSPSANYFYALALWKRSQPAPSAATIAETESLLNTAIRLDAKFGEAYLQRGILRASQQNSAAAIADFQQAIAEQPDLEEAHYRLAQVYRAAGKMDEARSEVEIYQRLGQQSKQETEREHHEIKQFVYSLRDKPASQIR